MTNAGMLVFARMGRRSLGNHSKARPSLLYQCLARNFLRILAFLLVFWCLFFVRNSVFYDHGTRHKAAMQFAISPRTTTTNDIPTIAHIVSLITCEKTSRVKGFLDALIILRHSIHQNSVYNHKRSKYAYQMIAFVHRQGGCIKYIPLLRKLGYIPLVRDTPVNVSAITTNDWYRTNVRHENCCGDKEFIKLYAYTLTDYPIFVHWDLDTALLQPMDDLLDSMVSPTSSPVGRAARHRLHLQHPTIPLPESIDAFYTRDITSAKPWEKVTAVQGGFLVGRPNMSHYHTYLRFIMEAHYTPGRGPTSGWGGMGYGGFQGAMAYQGVLAYFYDQIYAGRAVELDVCRWNNVVADVIWRGPEHPEWIGTCRQYPLDGNFDTNTPELGRCEDCRVVPVENTMSVHFTACRKPWDCTVPKPKIPNKRNKEHLYRLQNLTNKTTCRDLFRKYFEFRKQFEALLRERYGVGPESPGMFEPSYFGGYCKGRGDYISMQLPENFDAAAIYGF